MDNASNEDMDDDCLKAWMQPLTTFDREEKGLDAVMEDIRHWGRGVITKAVVIIHQQLDYHLKPRGWRTFGW